MIPAGLRPLWRSRPNWASKVWLIDSAVGRNSVNSRGLSRSASP
jgi:hypothetical protein